MTRGQIAIIKNGYNNTIEVMTSTEFNGDMYMPTSKWAGHGRQVINLLKKVYDVASYQFAVAKFNVENHHYNDCDNLTHKENESVLDFTKDYFDNWFSDYVYIKNITGKNVVITTTSEDDKETIHTELEPNDIAVLCFGTLEKLVKGDK